MLYFTYGITARLKRTLRYKSVLSIMQNKQPGNFVFKRKLGLNLGRYRLCQ